MRRREFIGLFGAAAISRPLPARAQAERIARVGVLINAGPDESSARASVASLQQGLQDVGWTVGRNLRLDIRWSGGDSARLRKDAAELVVGSDVIVAGVGPTLPILQQATRTVPVVMAQGLDPIGAGFIQSMARPGGNITGFTQFEYNLSGKWLELLKEIAPRVSRVGVVREMQGGPVGIGQWAVIGAFASTLGVELSPINLTAMSETEQSLSAFAPGSNGGLIVTVGSIATLQRDLIVAMAARNRLPAVYPYRYYVEAGGLISYGPNLSDLYQRSASYVARILKGEKPAELPVQAPTKYELVLNLKTAKALGITVPLILQQRADDVIE
jgi:putative ABC transport system substrate-binding protein